MFSTGFRSAGFSTARLSSLGLAAVLVLGGCWASGSDPDAEAAEAGSSSAVPSNSAGVGDDATESAKASPAPTPTPTAAYKPGTAEGPAQNVPLPVMPELAKQESKEGLEAFAEYWYQTVNYAFETGDLEPFQAINSAECIICNSVFDIVGPGYKNDDWIVGGRLAVLNLHSTYMLTSKNLFQVLVQLRQDSYEYRGPSNHLYEVNNGLPPTTVHLIEASYVNGHWYADNVVAIK